MTPAPRSRPEDSDTRSALVEATEQIMLEEGYAAVSTRRIAERVGVKSPLIHYYFRTMDDLFLEVLRRASERTIERLNEALEGEDVLAALWEMNRDRGGRLSNEFMAIANHRPIIKAEIVAYAERLRQMQTEALARYCERSGFVPKAPVPVAAVIITGLARLLGAEAELGVSGGHAETMAYLEEWLKPPKA
jgi:AcrR family transcriptional regulator